MYKAGANRQDKNRIVELHLQGKSPGQIQALTLVKEKQVRAVISQFNDGKLRAGKVDYQRGDESEGHPMNGPAQSELDALQEENALLKDQLAATHQRQEDQQNQINQILASQNGEGDAGETQGAEGDSTEGSPPDKQAAKPTTKKAASK